MNAPFQPPSPFSAAILRQRDLIAEARARALLREDCRAAKVLADKARLIVNEILRRQ